LTGEPSGPATKKPLNASAFHVHCASGGEPSGIASQLTAPAHATDLPADVDLRERPQLLATRWRARLRGNHTREHRWDRRLLRRSLPVIRLVDLAEPLRDRARRRDVAIGRRRRRIDDHRRRALRNPWARRNPTARRRT